MLEAHTGNGMVLECDITSADDMAFSPKLQTISYAIARDLELPKVQYKRAVPVGKALEFAPVWDGIDLIQAFS